MIIMGCLGKFGALFVTIPDPVIGGLFMVVFGMSPKSALTNTHSEFVKKKKSFNLSGFYFINLKDIHCLSPIVMADVSIVYLVTLDICSIQVSSSIKLQSKVFGSTP